MITRTEYKKLLKKVDQLSEEIEEIRKMLFHQKPGNGDSSREAWSNLMKLSRDISTRWEGPSAAEEIRDQRNKGY